MDAFMIARARFHYFASLHTLGT